MKSNELKLAISILKSTGRYQIGQIMFRVENDRLFIWCNSNSDMFFAPELSNHFAQFMCHYSYDSQLNKVVLIVY